MVGFEGVDCGRDVTVLTVIVDLVMAKDANMSFLVFVVTSFTVVMGLEFFSCGEL